eukprot:1788145-Amphidinium_carterae.1
MSDEWLSLRSRTVLDTAFLAEAEKRAVFLSAFAHMVKLLSQTSFMDEAVADSNSQEKMCQVIEEFYKMFRGEKGEYSAVVDMCKEGIQLERHLGLINPMHKALPEIRDIDKGCSTTANLKRNLMRIQAAKQKVLELPELPPPVASALAKLESRLGKAEEVLKAVHSGMVVKSMEKLKACMANLQQLA